MGQTTRYLRLAYVDNPPKSVFSNIVHFGMFPAQDQPQP